MHGGRGGPDARWGSVVVAGLMLVLAAGCAEPNPTAGVVARPPASTGEVVLVASESPVVDPTGTIVVAGVEHVVSGRSVVMTDSGGSEPGDGDFGICTAAMPTDPDRVAIIVAVGDDELTFRVTDGSPELSYGESLVADDVTFDVDYESDGHRVVGSATLPKAGLVEFDVDCP